MAPSTARQYGVALRLFNEFRREHMLETIWPVPLEDIMSFIAYMFRLELSHSTINCYISGLSFHHKISNLTDNTQLFVVRKLLEGVKRSKRQLDKRLPITIKLLDRILAILPCVCSSRYEAKLFLSVFSLAFYGLFRVGELTVGPKGMDAHTIKIENVKVHLDGIELFLATSKTDQFGRGLTIFISEQGNVNSCPVINLNEFLKVRPSGGGPLFGHFDRSPLTRYQFTSVMKKCLHTLGIEETQYASHSFRIGMATTCAMKGVSDDQIKMYGRWKSDAYARYIRIPQGGFM